MKKILFAVIVLSSLGFACSSSQSTQPAAPSPIVSATPSPSPSTYTYYPNVQFWVVDDNNNNLLDETSDGGQTYTQLALNDMPTIGTVAVSGPNVAIFGQDISSNPQLDVSSDNWTTYTSIDLSAFSADNLERMNLSGSNILFAGTDQNNNLMLQLSTDLGQTFTQLTLPNTVAGSFAYPGGISFDGNSILLKMVNSGNIYFYYSSDLQNYTDVTAQLATGPCASQNSITYVDENAGQVLGSCGSVVLYSVSGGTDTDLTANLTTGGFPISPNDWVSLQGLNVAVWGPNSSNADVIAYSSDNGATFAILGNPPEPSHTVQSTCFTPFPTPCTQTVNSRINTFGLY
jgi:hypothetical protein